MTTLRQWVVIAVLVGAGLIAGHSLGKPQQPVNPESLVKSATVSLRLASGSHCSGTMIGPKALLSAAHCFTGDRLLTVNNTPVNVVTYQHDGQDHAVLTLDTAFPSYVSVRYDGLKQGESVFMYGNPTMLDLLRRGYVSGVSGENTLLMLTVSGGDSGAGVFTQDGRLVGVLSGYMLSASGLHFSTVRPFSGPIESWPLVVED
jgi:hypothetical protein